MAIRPNLLLVLAPLLATPGCCSLASLFCGPDRSPWVPIRFETPESALRTFLEAIRRGNADVIYLCMDERWKQDLRLTGTMEANVVWDRIQEENPYIHLAGTAEVPEEPESRADRGASYLLEVSGYRFRVHLRQVPYWVVKGENDRQELLADGEYVKSLNDLVKMPTDEDPTLRIRLESTLYLDLLEDLVFAGVGREWRVRGVSEIEE